MSDKSIARELARVELFSGLNPDILEYLAGCASEREVAGGQALFHQSDPAESFFVVRSGCLSIEVPAIQGPALEVQRIGPGHVLGWSWLIPPYRWSFQGIATEEAEVLEFDGKVILTRCEQDPKFGYEVLKRFSSLMSERLEAARTRMMEEWNPPGLA